MHDRRHTGEGLGPTVQFTSCSLTAFSHSVLTGELSRPSRSGSRPARIEGSVPPDRLMIAHFSAAAARAWSYDQVVAYPIESSPPNSIRARLRCRSK